jgi:oligosaccharide repeat unit polymerase
MCLGTYVKGGKDIVAPPFVVTFVFTISTAIALANITEWKAEMHINTVLVIIISLFFFYFGYYSAWHLRLFKAKKVEKKSTTIYIHWLILLIMIFFTILTCYMYYQEQYRLALTQGKVGNFFSVFAKARHASYYTEESVSKLVQRMVLVTKCFAYTCIFVFLNNAITFGYYTVSQLVYIIPFLSYSFLMFMSGGRMPFIHMFAFVAILASTLTFKKNGNIAESRMKIHSAIIKAILAFFTVFIVMGLGSGKISSNSIFRSISIYSGSSINALDIFLNKEVPEEKLFGQETLIPIYSAMKSFGADIPREYLRSAREAILLNGSKTNIYTALRRYIRDYGYVGCCFVMFVIGFFYSKFYRYILYENESPYLELVYASIFFPLVEMSIEERFMLKLFSVSEVYELVIMFLICRFCFMRFSDGKREIGRERLALKNV